MLEKEYRRKIRKEGRGKKAPNLKGIGLYHILFNFIYGRGGGGGGGGILPHTML